MAQPRVVTIHYTLTNDQGEQLDSSRVEGREPLSYLEGAQNIIGGLESALNKKNAGDQVKVSVAPAEGYGEVNEELIQPVPRSAFEGVDTIEPGMQFQAQTPGGPQIVRVVEVSDETVTIDANHPLAGQTLHFDVEVVEAREATAEEQEPGHVNLYIPKVLSNNGSCGSRFFLELWRGHKKAGDELRLFWLVHPITYSDSSGHRRLPALPR